MIKLRPSRPEDGDRVTVSNVLVGGVITGFTDTATNQPGVLTANGHGLQTGQEVTLSNVWRGLNIDNIRTDLTPIRVDTGTSAQGGRVFGRQAFVSLGGDFGTVALGRQYGTGYLLLDSLDPFATGTVAAANNVYLGEGRLDNQATYASPAWGGFSFAAGYTNDAYDNEPAGTEGGGDEVRAWMIAPKYARGPLTVALNVSGIELDSSTAANDGDEVRIYDLGASYDFGVARLAAIYGIRNADGIDFGLFPAAGEDSRQWLVGLTVPLGAAGNVLASYARRTTEVAGGGDAESSQWGIGYEYWMSKRTGLYATYAATGNNDVAEASGVLVASVGDATSGGDGYQRGFNLGIRHFF